NLEADETIVMRSVFRTEDRIRAVALDLGHLRSVGLRKAGTRARQCSAGTNDDVTWIAVLACFLPQEEVGACNRYSGIDHDLVAWYGGIDSRLKIATGVHRNRLAGDCGIGGVDVNLRQSRCITAGTARGADRQRERRGVRTVVGVAHLGCEVKGTGRGRRTSKRSGACQ